MDKTFFTILFTPGILSEKLDLELFSEKRMLI